MRQPLRGQLSQLVVDEGNSCSEPPASPCSTAERIRVTSFIDSFPTAAPEASPIQARAASPDEVPTRQHAGAAPLQVNRLDRKRIAAQTPGPLPPRFSEETAGTRTQGEGRRPG